MTNVNCTVTFDYPDIAKTQIMRDGIMSLAPIDFGMEGYWIDVSILSPDMRLLSRLLDEGGHCKPLPKRGDRASDKTTLQPTCGRLVACIPKCYTATVLEHCFICYDDEFSCNIEALRQRQYVRAVHYKPSKHLQIFSKSSLAFLAH